MLRNGGTGTKSMGKLRMYARIILSLTSTTKTEEQDQDKTKFQDNQQQFLINRSEEFHELRKEIKMMETLLGTLVNQVQLMRQELQKK